jgi:hypothetical protein
MNDSGHSLDGRLEGYYQGPIPRVPWATDYDPKIQYMIQLPLVANGWGVTHPVLDVVPSLLTKGDGPPTEKDLNLDQICTSPFPISMATGSPPIAPLQLLRVTQLGTHPGSQKPRL